jgi:hypothetical protein
MNPINSPNQPPPDVSGPTSSPSPSSDIPPPDLGSKIPVKTQSTPPSPPQPPKPAAADDDLDKIMQDVGQQLKNEDKQPSKKRRSFFGRKPKNQPEAKLHAQPLPPAVAQPLPAAPQARAPLPQPAIQPTPPKTSSAPVLVITLTIIVTSILIIAAIYAYKK